MTNINDYIIRDDQKVWQPLIEKGIHYTGVSVISLHYNDQRKRSTTILLKFEPGAAYPYHNHPAGEEIYVLNGDVIIEQATLNTGDYLYTPPGFKHSVTTYTGCTLLLIIPEEVEIISY